MVVFFQHSFLKQHLAIFAVMILFWLPGFIMPQQITATEDLTMPLYDLVARILDLSPYIMETTAFLLFMLSTFLFNSILTANQLIGRNSTMGALVFMMSMCSFNATVLSPFIMACPIILLVLHIMFMINQTENRRIISLMWEYFCHWHHLYILLLPICCYGLCCLFCSQVLIVFGICCCL